MKISYGITVHNEADELNKLLEVLLDGIDEEDEVVICVDGNNESVKNVIDKYSIDSRVIDYNRKLDGNFADQKNYVIEQCEGDYIFHIDADEYPHETLLEQLPQILKINDVDENYIQFVDSKNRKMVDIMLSKMKKYIDVIIPRGGKNLVKRVQEFSTVPIIGHLEGICHTFVDKDAEPNMASKIIYNAKLRNTAICGATETILLHEKIVKKFCNPILKRLEDQNCKIYGDNIVRKYYKGKMYPAKEKDWSTEYLTAAVSVKVVKSSDEAINHINKYGTMHTDSIITKNKKTANKFLKNVKSSIAMHNTSTQFADGGEFGFGGEVGISTNTLPPRGPVGLEQLVSYKYEISSKGKIRK